ncbi:hypothetical protein TIFTF001_021325 [Ficus carica]|uniref:Uncharacterized protein n=1 Tax=Ficus carica TaxID=3494 RepID=A0AA88AK76_FICCA|nr:hypothetical protein TIFTF001_021325 [Ficus carica]
MMNAARRTSLGTARLTLENCSEHWIPGLPLPDFAKTIGRKRKTRSRCPNLTSTVRVDFSSDGDALGSGSLR